MLMLQGGKAYAIPECKECGSRMLPKDLDAESRLWKCPECSEDDDAWREINHEL